MDHRLREASRVYEEFAALLQELEDSLKEGMKPPVYMYIYFGTCDIIQRLREVYRRRGHRVRELQAPLADFVRRQRDHGITARTNRGG